MRATRGSFTSTYQYGRLTPGGAGGKKNGCHGGVGGDAADDAGGDAGDGVDGDADEAGGVKGDGGGGGGGGGDGGRRRGARGGAAIGRAGPGEERCDGELALHRVTVCGCCCVDCAGMAGELMRITVCLSVCGHARLDVAAANWRASAYTGC